MSLQCFSSVVGPNGSGKSNVIDAMLFVFGRRAKQVGAYSMHVVLHKPLKQRSVLIALAAAVSWSSGCCKQRQVRSNNSRLGTPLAAQRLLQYGSTMSAQQLPSQVLMHSDIIIEYLTQVEASSELSALTHMLTHGVHAMQLRFNKVAELIHNSTNHRNLERACVTVHFQEIIDKVATQQQQLRQLTAYSRACSAAARVQSTQFERPI